MKLTNMTKNEILVIALQSNRLDVKDAPKFKEDVVSITNNSDQRDVILDLSLLNFIDSSGVGSLLSILRLLNARGGELKLACVNPSILTVLELISMHKIFEIYSTIDAAIKSFNPKSHNSSPTDERIRSH